MWSSAGARVSAAVCGLLVVSAFLPIPLPRRVFSLQLGSGTAQVHAERLHAVWGLGKVTAQNLEVQLDGRLLARIPAAHARLDLRFWSARRLQPRWLEVQGGRIELDAERLRVLTGGAPTAEVPVLPLRWQGGSIVWNGPELAADANRIEVELLEGRLAPELARLHAVVLGPYASQAEFWLEGRDSFRRWSAAVQARAGAYAHAAPLPPPLRAAGCESLRLAASGSGGAGERPDLRLRAEVAGLSVALAEPPLELDGFTLAISGDLAHGLQAQVRGEALGVPLAGRVHGAGTWPQLAVTAHAETQPFALDEAWTASARALDRGVADVLDGLQPRGQARARLALRWRHGAPVEYLAHFALDQVTAAFRGFLEDDGERPSFPYPLEHLRGDIVLAQRRVAAVMDGGIGAGAVHAEAAVEIGADPAGVAVEVTVENFACDARVVSAAAGTPAIQEVVRLLGGPEGGSIGVRISVRRATGVQDGVVAIQAQGRGVQLRPSFLPMAMFAEDFEVSWAPGHGRFRGRVNAMDGQAAVRGEIHALTGREEPLLRATVQASGLRPNLEERKVLEHYLRLPPGSAGIEAGGAATLHLDFRRAGTAEPEVLLALAAEEVDVAVASLGLRADAVAGSAAALQAGGRTLVVLPEAVGTVAGAAIRAALVFAPEVVAERTRCMIAASDIQPTREIVNTLVAAARREEAAPLQPGGRLDARLEFVPGQRRLPRGVAELQPLTLRRAGALESEELAIEGRVQFDGLAASAARLQVRAQDGSLELRDFSLVADELGVLASAYLHGEEGFVISDRFAALVSPDAWAALHRIGLRGRVGADGLRLDLELPRGGKAGFHAEGLLWLADMSLQGPPEMRRGAGRLQVEHFDWSGPGDFGGRMWLEDGRVEVSGLATREMTADVLVTPSAITLQRLTATTLGGRVRTFGRGPNGEEEHGVIRLGLTPEAPITALLHLEGLSLARVADELNVAAGMSGKLRGRMQLRSPTPDPLDYFGRARLEVQDGRLGTVPVLRNLWRVLDLNPPLFRTASMDFSFGGAGNPGTVYVEQLSLEHPVLAVMAKGWIDMDGYVRMKATVRTFHRVPVLGFVLGLPLVRDLVDVLVEQNIFGPFDRLVITQRAFRGGGDDRRHPFPLWTPDIPQPNWQRSPVLPASGRTAGETD